MTKHIAYPKTPQFRDIVKQVCDTAKYHNEAEPTLTFTGSVKLHGTNHAVCFDAEGTMYTQSRSNLTSFASDNAGSAACRTALAKWHRTPCRIQRSRDWVIPNVLR